jgi:hypothetical protein
VNRVNIVAGVVTRQFIIPAATLFPVTALPGQLWASVQRLSGGSLEVGGSYSISQAGATTGMTFGGGYLIGTNPLQFQSSETFFLYCTGSTVVAQVLLGKTQGD